MPLQRVVYLGGTRRHSGGGPRPWGGRKRRRVLPGLRPNILSAHPKGRTAFCATTWKLFVAKTTAPRPKKTETWAMRLFFPKWMRIDATAAMPGDRTVLATLHRFSAVVFRHQGIQHPIALRQIKSIPCNNGIVGPQAGHLHLLPFQIWCRFRSYVRRSVWKSNPFNTPGVAYTTSGRLTEAGWRDVLTEKLLSFKVWQKMATKL